MICCLLLSAGWYYAPFILTNGWTSTNRPRDIVFKQFCRAVAAFGRSKRPLAEVGRRNLGP
jgi:hypothetical protein